MARCPLLPLPLRILLTSLPLWMIAPGCSSSVTTYEAEATWMEHFPASATASSYAQGYAADETLLGEPDLDEAACTDNQGQAWRSQFADEVADEGLVRLDLEFPHDYLAEKISIYEGANPGAVIQIRITPSDDGSPTVLTVEDTVASCPGTLELEIPEDQQVPTNRITVYIDTTLHPGAYEEIDAVSLWDYEVRE